jgi:hypothetical protein
MPQDPDLYGQRPSKKQKRTALASSLDFTAQLTSLMSDANAATPASGRTRPSKERKGDIFSSRNASGPNTKDKSSNAKLVIKDVHGTEEEAHELARARRKMEDKARLYAAMRRGDYVPKENEPTPLVDFDRKWAESTAGNDGLSDHSSSNDDDDDDEKDRIVEYEDEFGRLRQGTQAEVDRIKRRRHRGLLGAEELERMSARPSEPSKLIYGDAIQTMAFVPEDTDQMEALARKRDRSATPPEQKHYDADWEIRTKGTGFYKFSKDEEVRTKEMEALEEERKRTEDERRQRDADKEKRRKEIEARRRQMAERKAKKQADSFLEDMYE